MNKINGVVYQFGRYYMKSNESKFIISPEVYDRCVDFSNASVDTSVNKYASRNQFDISKIKKDIRNGKIAEEGAWEILSKTYPNLSKPDHSIYTAKQKSWDADLKDPSIPISVAIKSQDIESEINFGRSWVFQFNKTSNYDRDTGIFAETDNNHYVTFISLNIPKRFGTIQAIVKVKWLHDHNLFKPMMKTNLQNNKLAIYYDDLVKFQDELWQI